MSRPWMPLYLSDYLGDTRRLKTVEHGAYMLLIMEYWQHGGLPDNDGELAEIVGMELDEWLVIRDRIARLFKDGWRHKRIDEELAKAEEISERRSASAKRRWSKSDANAEQAQLSSNARARVPQPQPQPQPQLLDPTLPSEVPDPCPKPPTARRTKNEYPSDFEKFWQEFPTDANMSKAEAAKAWKALSDPDRRQAMQSLVAFKSYCRSHPDYRPVHACRYLTQRRFEGHAQAAAKIAATVRIRKTSPQGEAWEAYGIRERGKGYPWANGYWNFPTEWPPDAVQDLPAAAE